MLNRAQFQPHAFMDPQPEGLYVGRQLFRSARVYAADLDAPENADDPNEPGGGRPVNRSSFMAHVPLENGSHVQLHWNESKSHSEDTVGVAAMGGIKKPASLSRWSTNTASPDEATELIGAASRDRVNDRRTPEEAAPWVTAGYERYR